jgi:hypothetical protein
MWLNKTEVNDLFLGIDTVRKYQLQKEKTAIFFNSITKSSFNFPKYPLMARQLLKKEGDGFQKLHIFATGSFGG